MAQASAALLHRWRLTERLRAVEHLLATGQTEGWAAEEMRDELRARLANSDHLTVEPDDV